MMHFLSLLLECHINKTICPLEFLMQYLGLRFNILPEQFLLEQSFRIYLPLFQQENISKDVKIQFKHFLNKLFGKHCETFKRFADTAKWLKQLFLLTWFKLWFSPDLVFKRRLSGSNKLWQLKALWKRWKMLLFQVNPLNPSTITNGRVYFQRSFCFLKKL